MPWGKHCGVPLKDTPLHYRDSLVREQGWRDLHNSQQVLEALQVNGNFERGSKPAMSQPQSERDVLKASWNLKLDKIRKRRILRKFEAQGSMIKIMPGQAHQFFRVCSGKLRKGGVETSGGCKKDQELYRLDLVYAYAEQFERCAAETALGNYKKFRKGLIARGQEGYRNVRQHGWCPRY